MNIHWKDWCWSWSSNPLATWFEEPTHWKDCDARKDWGQEKWATEDEMVGWHHQLSGHKFEQTLGDSEGQGSLAWCSTWGHKELDIETEQQQCFIYSSLSQSYFSTIFTLLPRLQISWVSLLFFTTIMVFYFHFFLFPECHMIETMQFVVFSNWLLYLSSIHWWFLYGFWGLKYWSFIFIVEHYSIAWIYHSLFIHSHTEGFISCF